MVDFVEEVAVAREIEQFYQAHFMELLFKIIFSLREPFKNVLADFAR